MSKMNEKAKETNTPMPVASIVNLIKAVARHAELESKEARVGRWAIELTELAEGLIQMNLGINTGNPPVEKSPPHWMEAIALINHFADRIERNDHEQHEKAREIRQLAENVRQALFGQLTEPN